MKGKEQLMKCKYLAVIGLIAALATFALVPAHAQAPQPAAVRIAVASPGQIFNSIQETKDISQQREAANKALEAQRQQKEQHVRDLTQALQLLKPDSPGYSDKRNEAESASVDYEVWVKITQANQERDAKMQLRALWDKVTAAVAEVATQKGYDLVLADSREEIPDDIDRVTGEQLQALIHTRNVLFASAQTDITQDVIASMDAKYKAARPQ
jgi:Skp family chaperone for outer membrane proteins